MTGLATPVLAASTSAFDQPGTLGFLVVFGMGVILFFVFRSMAKHLRKVNTAARLDASAPAGTAPDGTTLDGTTFNGTALDGTTPGGTASGGTALDGTAAESDGGVPAAGVAASSSQDGPAQR